MRCPHCNKLIVHRFNGNYNQRDKEKKRRHMKLCPDNPETTDHVSDCFEVEQ